MPPLSLNGHRLLLGQVKTSLCLNIKRDRLVFPAFLCCSTIVLKAQSWQSILSTFCKLLDMQADSQAHSDLLNLNLWGCNSDNVLMIPKEFCVYFSLGSMATASCSYSFFIPWITWGMHIIDGGVLSICPKISLKCSFVNLLFSFLLFFQIFCSNL